MQAKIVFYLGLLISGLIFSGATTIAQSLTPANVPVLDLPESSALETALRCADQTGAAIFVIAGRKSCPPCRTLTQQIKTDESTRQWLRNCVKVYLDCDSAEYQRWIAIHPPTDTVLPQWFLVRADGQELINRAGAVSIEELRMVLQSSFVRAGKRIDESDSSRIEELVVKVKGLLESQDVIEAAQAIMHATTTLRVASNNYGAFSNQLRELLVEVQTRLVRQINSAREQLNEIEGLSKSVQIERIQEAQRLINRLRSVPSVSGHLHGLELELESSQHRIEQSVQR
jgi:hypothetical protein